MPLEAPRILVDTSLWIEHLRHGVNELARSLLEQRVLVHSFVVGELGCGRLAARAEVLLHLSRLPRVKESSHAEAMALVERWNLAGRGVGWVDVHLLASARLDGCALWTRDRRLLAVAKDLGLT